MKASYTAENKAVVKDGGAVIWKCGHYHRNRWAYSPHFGDSAMDCAKKKLRELENEGATHE